MDTTVRSEDPISIVFETGEISKIVDKKYNGALWTCRQWLTCVTRSPKRRVLNFKQRFASAVCVKSSYVFHEFAAFETFFVVCSWNVKDNLSQKSHRSNKHRSLNGNFCVYSIFWSLWTFQSSFQVCLVLCCICQVPRICCVICLNAIRGKRSR